MRESTIVASILVYLRGRGDCFCWKEHGGMYSTAGLPDIICCIDGRFVSFEVKTSVGKLSRLQMATIRKIRKMGGVAEKVTSVAEVRRVLHDNGFDEAHTDNKNGGNEYD